MNRIEYSLCDIRNNIMKNKKRMFVIFLIFSIAGLFIGVIQGLFYKQPSFTLDDTIVQRIDIRALPRDTEYYYTAVTEYTDRYEALKAYVMYLKQVSLTGESTEDLEDFEMELIEFSELIDSIKKYYKTEMPIICNDRENAKDYIEDKIEEYKGKIKNADDVIKNINSESFSKSFAAISETSALKNKISAQNELHIWENQLDGIKKRSDEEIENANEKMDELLLKREKEFNTLVDKYNVFIRTIEKREQYDIIYNKYLLNSYVEEAGLTGEISKEDALNNRKNNAVIYAKSVAGTDVPKERLYAIFMFYSLVGVALAVLFGAFYKYNKE